MPSVPSRLLAAAAIVALARSASAQSAPAPPPAPSSPSAPSAPSSPTSPSAPLVAVFDVHALGVDPSAAAHVTAELRRTAEALGYAVLPPDAARAAVARLQTAGAVTSDRASELTRSVLARHGIFASLGSTGAAYVVELQVVRGEGGTPASARTEAGAADLARATERLLRSVLPPAPPPPAPAVVQAPAPAPAAAPKAPSESTQRLGKWRLGLQTEGAIGIGGNEFYNHLAGGRLDYRATRRVAFGLYLGYANLKGKDGRAHNVLSYGQVEYAIPLGSGPLKVPLRYGIGYLPKNGPFMRTSAGLGFAVSDSVDIVLDLVAPTFWVTYDQTVVSMDLAAELALTF